MFKMLETEKKVQFKEGTGSFHHSSERRIGKLKKVAGGDNGCDVKK